MIEQQKEHSKASEEIIIEDLNRIVDALSMHLQNDTSGKISELNLFKALGIDRREIYICRFIGALLENEGYLISFRFLYKGIIINHNKNRANLH